MDALLNASDQQTEQGRRDYALLLFLYNTGARANEASQLTIIDLNVAHAKKETYLQCLLKEREIN